MMIATPWWETAREPVVPRGQFYISLPNAAKRLGVSHAAVREMMARGTLRFKQTSHITLIFARDVALLLPTRETPADESTRVTLRKEAT